MSDNPADRIHKATPDDDGFYCAVCGQPVKRVAGGQGLVYIHTDSGAVAAPNPPGYSPADPTEAARRALLASGQPQLDLAAAHKTCGWCGEELYEFEGTWHAERRAGLICKVGPGGGAYPAHKPGGWTTDEFRETFTALGFLAPFVVVRRKSDDLLGSVEFTHSPRTYFNFQPDRP